jgi:hypothetical protein
MSPLNRLLVRCLFAIVTALIGVLLVSPPGETSKGKGPPAFEMSVQQGPNAG